ncbi:MAG TPA: energy transducer TonB [Dissulfurispiraceae bacterium]
MNYQLKALQVSVAVHLLVVVTLLGLGGFFEPVKKRIVIDFSIEDQAPAPDSSSPNLHPGPVKEVRQIANTRAVERAAVSPSPEQHKAEQRPQEVPAVAPALSGAQAPVAAPPAPQRQMVKNDAVTRVRQGIAEARPVQHAGSAAQAGRIAISGSNNARNRNYKEYYTSVRDLINKKAVLPRMAEKLKLEGGVEIFLAVAQNGQLIEVRLVQSSGKELLDKSAIEAVRRASPFPKPPVDAELEMTVRLTYRLPD